MRRSSCMAVGAAVCAWLAGCSASVPEGIYACKIPADCPSGFECREDSEGSFCYRSDGAPAGQGGERAGRGGTGVAGEPGDGGMPGAGRGGAAGDAGMPMAGTDEAPPPVPVAPSATGFATLGGVRSGSGLRLYDERFERGERRCSADARICVTGGFEP